MNERFLAHTSSVHDYAFFPSVIDGCGGLGLAA
jgi:hypothetical protein